MIQFAFSIRQVNHAITHYLDNYSITRDILFVCPPGMNQLLWYYADLEHDKCEKLLEMKRLESNNSDNTFASGVFDNEREPEGCILWRRFSKWVGDQFIFPIDLLSCLTINRWNFFFFFSLFETSQTLFWAAFGLIELESFDLAGIKSFTRFWGLLMFGCFSVINIVVLLNLLIAMINHSYQLIFVRNWESCLWQIIRYKKNKMIFFVFLGKGRRGMEICEVREVQGNMHILANGK